MSRPDPGHRRDRRLCTPGTQGTARIWPLIAESWAIVTVPTFVLLGDPVAGWVGGGHLIVGYALLGVILARRPELTGAR